MSQPIPIFHRRGDTLVSVVVAAVIISFVVFAIATVLSNNRSMESEYLRNDQVHIMELNATNVLRRIDTAGLPEKTLFSLEKDPVSRRFIVHTGSFLEDFSYVGADEMNVTNTGTYQGNVYRRTFFVSQYDSSLSMGNQIIKGTIRELIRK